MQASPISLQPFSESKVLDERVGGQKLGIGMAKPEPSIPRNENPEPGQQSPHPQNKVRRLIAEVAQAGLGLAVAAGLLGGGAYLLSQCHRQPAASISAPTPAPVPTVTAAPTVSTTPTVPTTPPLTVAPAGTPAPTPQALPTPAPASPPPTAAPASFEDDLKRLLQASSSGFRELRGKLMKTETGNGPYALFRFRKIYQGTALFGGSDSAQLEEVYYTNANQPVYNYHLYFQEPSDEDSASKYDDLRSRLDQILQGFVHTSAAGYDAWAASDAKGTAVLLNSRDPSGSLEIQVHAAFTSPQW
ncbi:MAG: hypothetical protein WB586_17995 [Chthoniobacterales bacterium]